MLAKFFTASIVGIDAILVDVEVDSGRGLPSFTTVGLPDNAVKESRERVRAAIKNSGYEFPSGRITVNLAPADVKKEGTSFDLPVAAGILKTQGLIKIEDLSGYILLGELSLDGTIKSVKGALSAAAAARSAGKKLVVPMENVAEAAIVEGAEIYGIKNLSELVEFLNGDKPVERAVSSGAVHLVEGAAAADVPDLSDVKGQEHVKRALEVCAAGGHNILMIGPPGSGKTMLARRLPGILPSQTLEEAIETTKVHSVAGVLESGRPLVVERPFRAPHHTVSDAGLIGGGQIPKPGEVSLSHNGVLFLDEVLEFKKNVLEMLRQPLEDGRVTISRAAISITYPSSFMLVCAMNPCPCGFLGDMVKECLCTPLIIKRYRSRLSGPLLDRIDVHCEVPRVRFSELGSDKKGEGSEAVKKRVEAARSVQRERFSKSSVHSNARMTTRQLKKYCAVDGESSRLLEAAVEKLGFSARAHARILKVARTIADLDGQETIRPQHIAEAIQYRTLDRHTL